MSRQHETVFLVYGLASLAMAVIILYLWLHDFDLPKVYEHRFIPYKNYTYNYIHPYNLFAAERLGKWEEWEENKHVIRFFNKLYLGDIYDDLTSFLNKHDFYGNGT